MFDLDYYSMFVVSCTVDSHAKIGYPIYMKCYYEECQKNPEWHVFVEPGTFACDEHAPGDYSEPIN